MRFFLYHFEKNPLIKLNICKICILNYFKIIAIGYFFLLSTQVTTITSAQHLLLIVLHLTINNIMFGIVVQTLFISIPYILCLS